MITLFHLLRQRIASKQHKHTVGHDPGLGNTPIRTLYLGRQNPEFLVSFGKEKGRF